MPTSPGPLPPGWDLLKPAFKPFSFKAGGPVNVDKQELPVEGQARILA
jgi:hypothetical protein